MAELGEQFPAVLSAAVAGDVEAFGVLWRSAHPMLLRYLRVLCGEAAEWFPSTSDRDREPRLRPSR